MCSGSRTSGKPVVVYVQPRKRFVDVRMPGDLTTLLSEVDRRLAKQLQQDAVADQRGTFGSLFVFPSR